MNKNYIIGIVLLVLVGLGFFFFWKHKEPSVVTPEGGTSTTTAVAKLEIASLVEEHSTTTYTSIDLSYPNSSSTQYPEIYDFVTQAKADFKKDYGSITNKEAKEWGLVNGEPYAMKLTTRIATSTNTVSYILELYEYTGGAHGGTSVHTFTYNTDKKIVLLDDVFAQPFLDTVSTKARIYLTSKLGADLQKDMMVAGTEPTRDNFAEWYLTPGTVTFIFGQYQVGPYVIGIQEFPLKKSEIANLLAPEFK